MNSDGAHVELCHFVLRSLVYPAQDSCIGAGLSHRLTGHQRVAGVPFLLIVSRQPAHVLSLLRVPKPQVHSGNGEVLPCTNLSTTEVGEESW